MARKISAFALVLAMYLNTAAGQQTAAPSQTPTANHPRKLRISSGLAETNLIHKVQPVYPPEAKANNVKGEVVLQCLIGKDGSVTNLKVVSGHPWLAQSALDAVRQWKYRPFLLNGEPVEIETSVKVRFHLR